MIHISEATKRRMEKLKSEFGFQKVDFKAKGRFYLQDYYIRVYHQLIDQNYGRSVANGVSHIYMCLASHSNTEGISWPGLALLMKECCQKNKNTLIKCINVMLELNMVRYLRGGGKGVSNVYLLTDKKFWKDSNSINKKRKVSITDVEKLQDTDTGRTAVKDIKNKDNELKEKESIIEDTFVKQYSGKFSIDTDTKLLPAPR